MLQWWTICVSLVVAWLGWRAAGFAAWWWRLYSGLRCSGIPAVHHKNFLLGGIDEFSRKDTSRVMQEWGREYGPGLFSYRVLWFHVRPHVNGMTSLCCSA